MQIGDGGLTGSILGDVVNDGTLVLNCAGALTLAGNISGAGGLRQIGAGAVTLAGDNSYGGGTELRAGALQVSRDANLGAASSALVFTGGSLATTADSRHQPVGDAVADRWDRRRGRHDAGDERPAVRRAACSRPAPARCGWLARATPMAALLVRAGTLIGDASISGGIGNAATVVFEQAADARYGGDIGALDARAA